MPACRPDPEPSATAMNLRFVEAFHWAVLLKSVTRAAEKLHLTQSALSSRIAALETELGVQLLDRRDKRLRLTPAGQRFHHHALKLLDLQRQVKQKLGSGQLRPQVQRVGVTGFCWGGGVTWLACQEFREIRAGAAWYGRLAPPPNAPTTCWASARWSRF